MLANLSAPEPAPSEVAGFIQTLSPSEGSHSGSGVVRMMDTERPPVRLTAGRLEIEPVLGSRFATLLPSLRPAQEGALALAWQVDPIVPERVPWKARTPVPAHPAVEGLPTADDIFLAVRPIAPAAQPLVAGHALLEMPLQRPLLPGFQGPASATLATSCSLPQPLAQPVPVLPLPTLAAAAGEWLAAEAPVWLPAPFLSLVEEGEAASPVAVPPPAEWMALPLEPIPGSTAVAEVCAGHLVIAPRIPELGMARSAETGMASPAPAATVELQAVRPSAATAVTALSPLLPATVLMHLPNRVVELDSRVAPPPMATFSAHATTAFSSQLPAAASLTVGSIIPAAHLPQPAFELAQPPVPYLADLLPDFQGGLSGDMDSMLGPMPFETLDAVLPETAPIDEVSLPIQPGMHLAEPADVATTPTALLSVGVPNGPLALPEITEPLPAAALEGPVESVFLTAVPDSGPQVSVAAGSTAAAEHLVLPETGAAPIGTMVRLAGGAQMPSEPSTVVSEPAAGAGWLEMDSTMLGAPQMDTAVAVVPAGFQPLAVNIGSPAEAAHVPAVLEAILGRDVPALPALPALEQVELRPQLADNVDLQFHVQHGQPVLSRREQWQNPRQSATLPRFTIAAVGTPSDQIALRLATPIDTARAAKSRDRSDYSLWGKGIAAGIAVCAFLWVGSMAVRNGRMQNTGTVASNNTPSVSLDTPPVKPSGGFVQRVRQAVANRATLELGSDFHNGKQFWDGSKADFGKGWERSAEGYMVPGQLAVYRPSLQLTDYRLEFMGQIENKGLGWVVRASDTSNYYAMKFNVVEPGLRPIISVARYAVVNGKRSRKIEVPLQVMVHNRTPYRVAVDVRGNHITTSIEGEQVDSWTDDTLAAGGVGFFSEGSERARLYWMKVTNNDDLLGRVCAFIAGTRTTARAGGQQQAFLLGDWPAQGGERAAVVAVAWMDRRYVLALTPASM